MSGRATKRQRRRERDDTARTRAAALELCRIYYAIAAEVVGEPEVRRRRDEALAALLQQEGSTNMADKIPAMPMMPGADKPHPMPMPMPRPNPHMPMPPGMPKPGK